MGTLENVWAWLTTAASNDAADSGVNWVEGQDPATVNNSARGMMAAIKKWANVNSGNVTVGGTADAITITTGQTISSGHQALGFRICFKAASTNTGAATVAVDGLSAVAIKRPNGDALSAGDIVSGAFHDIAFDGTNYRLFVPGAGGNYGVLSGGNTWTGTNIFQAGATVGDAAADVVVIKGQTVSTFGSQMLAATSASAWQSGLGLGTAALYNINTSGANVPLLNGSNTWSAGQNISFAVGSNWMFHILATDKTVFGNTWISTYFFDGSQQIAGSITHQSNGPSLPGNTTYGTSSDGRLKPERFRRPIADSGDIIDRLNPIYFQWGETGLESFGFVAQEVDQVVPGVVVRGDDGPYRGGFPGQGGSTPWQMQHGRLEAILVAEIQALRARLAALEAG
jgi:hypothetical protein